MSILAASPQQFGGMGMPSVGTGMGTLPGASGGGPSPSPGGLTL